MLEKEMLMLSMSVDSAIEDSEILESEDLENVLSNIEKNFQKIANSISSMNSLESPKVVIYRGINLNTDGLYGTMSSKTNTLTIYPIKAVGDYYFSCDFSSLVDTLAHELSHHLIGMKHDRRWSNGYERILNIILNRWV